MPTNIVINGKKFADGKVVFGGVRAMAVVGVLGGVAIALGLPYIVIVYGQSMGAVAQVLLTILALLTGGIIAGLSAFFGTVIPHSVEGSCQEKDAPERKD